MSLLQERVARIIQEVKDPAFAAELIADLAEVAIAQRLALLREQGRDRKRRQRERERGVSRDSHVTVPVTVTGTIPPPLPPSLSPPIPPPITPPDLPPPISSPLPRKAKGGVGEYSSMFLLFWENYPLKIGKGDAWNSWKKQLPPIEAVLRALAWQRGTAKWLEDGGKFIPHPATYLNQRRWEDEPATPRAGPAYQDAGKYLDQRDLCNWHREKNQGAAPSPVRWCPRCRRGGHGDATTIATLLKPEVPR